MSTFNLLINFHYGAPAQGDLVDGLSGHRRGCSAAASPLADSKDLSRRGPGEQNPLVQLLHV